MIDTHAHFNSKVLPNLKEKLELANSLPIDFFINVGLDDQTNLEVLKISQQMKKFPCSLGIHPIHQGKVETILTLYEKYHSKAKIVAIGETGLDYQETIVDQIPKFLDSIALANYLHLPVIIHANKTNKMVIDIIKKTPPLYGFVFHCFEPDLEIAQEIIKMDGFISFGKPITSPKAKKSLELVQTFPIDHILIELDYPYMSNHPTLDGKKVFQKIQALRNFTHQELEEQLDKNAKKLFKKLS